MCYFFLNSVLWLLLYLYFRLNVMGLLFVLVKMSVILNVYAFLGQWWKAVSFGETLFFCGQFVFVFFLNLCCSCWTFNSCWQISESIRTRVYTVTCNWSVQAPPNTFTTVSRIRLTHSQYLRFLLILHRTVFSSFVLLLIFLIRHIPRRQSAKVLPFDFVFYDHKHKALCIWGIWAAVLGKKASFFNRIPLFV